MHIKIIYFYLFNIISLIHYYILLFIYLYLLIFFNKKCIHYVELLDVQQEPLFF